MQNQTRHAQSRTVNSELTLALPNPIEGQGAKPARRRMRRCGAARSLPRTVALGLWLGLGLALAATMAPGSAQAEVIQASLQQQTIDAEAAHEFVRDVVDRALTDFAGSRVDYGQRRNDLRQLYDDTFAGPEIGRFVLGRYWKSASGDEQIVFLDIFRDLVIDATLSRLADSENSKVTIIDVAPIAGNGAGQGGALVRSVYSNDELSVRVDWRIAPYDEAFRVLDVFISGVSLVITKRDDFTTYISRNGGTVAPLIEELAARHDPVDEPMAEN